MSDSSFFLRDVLLGNEALVSVHAWNAGRFSGQLCISVGSRDHAGVLSPLRGPLQEALVSLTEA